MRLTWLLFARKPQRESTVPLRPVEPMSLKNHMDGSHDRAPAKGCLTEMTLLLACLSTDASGNTCKAEANRLQMCYKEYLKNKKLDKDQQKQKVPVPYARSLTQSQATYLLKKYPTI